MGPQAIHHKGLLRLLAIWWSGVKVFCRWAAFSIILTLLWLPFAILMELLAEGTGRVLGPVFLVLYGPISFYLASRHLLVLGEDDHGADEPRRAWSMAGDEGGDPRVRRKIGVSGGVAFLIASTVASPPDLISQLTAGTLAAVLCSVPLEILTRRRFMQNASPAVHSLVAVLLCFVAVLTVLCLAFMRAMAGR